LPNEKPKLNVLEPALKPVAKKNTILSVLSLSTSIQPKMQETMLKPNVKQRNPTLPNPGAEPCLTQTSVISAPKAKGQKKKLSSPTILKHVFALYLSFKLYI